MSGSNGYYGRPIVKPPAWTDLIPVYFFSGGMAGTCAMLALGERLAKNDRLARTLIFGAALGSVVSGYCLIADLKRPERFLKMLRVFKPTSPMSIGVYIFSIFGGASMTAAASELTGVARPLGRFSEVIAALFGPAMSVYTAVLIGDTVMPAWALPRATLPALFAATSASTAGAWGMLFGSAGRSESARHLSAIGGTATIAALQALHHEVGPQQAEAYDKGEAGAFSRTAKLLTIAGTACAIVSKRSSALSRFAGALLFAGGIAERFGVYRAGCASAKDPKYLLAAQSQTGPTPASSPV